jgi:hypothetical protein
MNSYTNYHVTPKQVFEPLNKSGRKFDPADFKKGRNPFSADKKKLGMINNPTGKGGAGPRLTYDKDYHDKWAFQFGLLGLTEKEIAEHFGISESTLENWKRDFFSFSKALYKGKEPADANIVRAMYERARGYTHADEEIKVVSRGAGLGSEIERVPTIKHYPPDVQAASLWLTNRQNQRWKVLKNIDHTTGGESLNKPFIEFLKESSVKTIDITHEEIKPNSDADTKDSNT